MNKFRVVAVVAGALLLTTACSTDGAANSTTTALEETAPTPQPNLSSPAHVTAVVNAEVYTLNTTQPGVEGRRVAPQPTASAAAPATTVALSTTSVDDRTGSAAPIWLGTRLLPLRPGDDNGVAQPTPPEFVDRQLWTTDILSAPIDDVFVSEVVTPPPDEVLARSTFREDCPVAADEIAYATVAFFGFDGRFHTGEFIARVQHVEALVAIFDVLHDMRFPLEQMQVTTQEAVDAHPTGDSNNTSSFVCRPAVNSSTWSRHALGGAIDINPFHNPYVKGDLVIPELATAYLDRDVERVGMVTPEIVALFADIGWGWGGNWNSARDWMHFSDTGG